MANQRRPTTTGFAGFERPTSNFFRMPNEWTDITADIRNLAELKVVEYILRHTWGYQEYDVKKHITIDEFVNGRRRQDGSRMDRGTGLSERAVYDGLRLAVEGGLIEQEVDDSDRGRTKKFYCLRMRPAQGDSPALQDPQPGVQSLHPPLQELHPPLQSLHPQPAKSAPRSEKDTGERQDLSNIRKVPTGFGSVGRDEGAHPPGSPGPRRGGEPQRVGEIVAASGRGKTGTGEVRLTADGGESTVAPSQGTAGLPRRAGRPRRVAQHDVAYQVLQAYVADFAREFNDQAPLRASTMRAYNLLRRSGLAHEEFVSHLYAARATTKERTGSIRSRAGEDAFGVPVKAKMAFFFAVLEDLLGLRDPHARGAADGTEVASAD